MAEASRIVQRNRREYLNCYEIAKRSGFEPIVLLWGLEDLEMAIEQNPFPEAETDPELCTLAFLPLSRSIRI